MREMCIRDRDEGGEIEGFTSYWDERTGRTDYILLAEIPVKEPWQAMAWLPMGGWNNCPTPFAMMMTCLLYTSRCV